MKILCFGSLNLDKVYQVPHFVRPGETLSASTMDTFCGGKGLNQSIALSKAGGNVFHAGAIGPDGDILTYALKDANVDITYLKILDSPTGHAIIQVDSNGQNCILLIGGANMQISVDQIEQTLQNFDAGDFLVLQNEINNLPYLIAAAAKKGMRIVLNPSPMTPELLTWPLDQVEYFVLNEIEAQDICGQRLAEEDYPDALLGLHPNAKVVLTLGAKGCIYKDRDRVYQVPARKVAVVDTTAAGDTFLGYFVAGVAGGKEVKTALEEATLAASIAVSRMGAAASIPWHEEIEKSS